MFPGAAADREDADYAIVGAPLDASTTFQPGTRFGPERIRSSARSFEDYDRRTDRQFSDLAVYDHGDVRPGGDVADYLDFLRVTLAAFHDEGVVPVLLGGEHTVTIPAVEAADPDAYVCLDAHLDLREAYAGDPLSHATVTHHVLDEVDEVILLGARSGTEAEWNRASRADVTVVPPVEIPAWEPSFADQSVYLSVDVDVVDPAFAPGTGTPEPFGPDSTAVHDVVRAVAPACCGFDVVEVNDRDHGQAAGLAAKLCRAAIYAHADG